MASCATINFHATMIAETEIARHVARLRELACNTDRENAHTEADRVLCDILKQMGLDDVVDAFDAVPKWFA